MTEQDRQMGQTSPEGTSKEPKSGKVPESLSQALVHAIWKSRWRTAYLVGAGIVLVVFTVWTSLPESSKESLLSLVGLGGPAQSEGVEQPARSSSLSTIDRAKLRFGLRLGWQLARFEFVDESSFTEARALAPTVRSDIARLLSQDGFPHPVEGLAYRELIEAVLGYYATTGVEKHAAILVGIAGFRASLVGVSQDETHNLAMERLAFSAIEDIDPSLLPDKEKFFRALLRKQPGNVPELLEFVDSTLKPNPA